MVATTYAADIYGTHSPSIPKVCGDGHVLDPLGYFVWVCHSGQLCDKVAGLDDHVVSRRSDFGKRLGSKSQGVARRQAIAFIADTDQATPFILRAACVGTMRLPQNLPSCIACLMSSYILRNRRLPSSTMHIYTTRTILFQILHTTFVGRAHPQRFTARTPCLV